MYTEPMAPSKKTRTQVKNELARWDEAVCDEDLGGMQAMVEEGFDIDSVHPKHGFTALQMCGRWKIKSSAGWLIAQGADVNLSSTVQLRPLWLAIKENDFDLAAMLLDAGADVLACNEDGDTIAISMVKQSMLKPQLGLLARMIDMGIDIDRCNNRGVNLRETIREGLRNGLAHDPQAWQDVMGAQQARALAEQIDHATPKVARTGARRAL